MEGTLGTRDDAGGGTFHVRLDARGRDSQNPEPVFSDEAITFFVARRATAHIMSNSIDLDDETRSKAA